jgi:hypothetical protein
MNRHEAEIVAKGHTHCPECEERVGSMDQLVDHLCDVHDAFSWVTAGWPLATDGGTHDY